MIIWADIWDPTKQRVFECSSVREPGSGENRARLQGQDSNLYNPRLRRIRMVTEKWVMMGDVDVG